MEESNRRIVKNTVYLYFRQFVIMALSFITTRVVLEKLGASDYGINNLVGGFVASFAVLNSILSTGTRRFLALYMGKGDENMLNVTFSTSVVIHLVIGILVVIALETGGLWFLNTRLNIAPDRMYAANWVFQLAVLGTFLGVVQTPYMAAVTAHEKFTVYAAMSIFDVVGKLVVIYMLIYLPGDKLIIYSVLNLSVIAIGILIYRIYCIRQFPECKWSLHVDKLLMKEMLHFSGWGVFGHVITVVNSQGLSIILNIFFNTVMNAARGLAQTVNVVVSQFITGFLTAAQPQLVKFYGAGEMERFVKLIFNVTQYTLFLIGLIVIPCLLEIDYVVGLWLGGDVPKYTCTFIKITLFCSIIYRSNIMVEDGLIAIGRVKENNMYSVPVYLLSIPLYYVAMKYGHSPVLAYWLASVPPLLSFIINLILLSKYTIFPGLKFFNDVFLKNTLLILVSAIVPFAVQLTMQPGFLRFLVVCTISVLSTFFVLWKWGMNDSARAILINLVRTKFLSKFKR